MITQAKATRDLRQLFGPTARFKSIDRAGLPGLQMLARGGVVAQTFDLSGDVYRRLMQAACDLYIYSSKL